MRLYASKQQPDLHRPALFRQLITAVAHYGPMTGNLGKKKAVTFAYRRFQRCIRAETDLRAYFRARCTDQWFQKSFTCGYCRQPIFDAVSIRLLDLIIFIEKISAVHILILSLLFNREVNARG